MKYFWFGDSWVAGDELKSGKTFAQQVSDTHGVECINLGECGSSIDDLPWQFFQHSNNIGQDDTVFFCLTASHRVSLFESGQLKRIMPSEMYDLHRPHPHAAHWYRYFDNLDQRAYNRSRTVNLLYYWCLAQNITAWFCNIFTVETQTSIDTTPDSAWLLPRDQCLAGCLLPVIDSTNLYLSDDAALTDQEWTQQRTAIEKFIRPNWTHPNEQGHQCIAHRLLQELDQREQISI